MFCKLFFMFTLYVRSYFGSCETGGSSIRNSIFKVWFSGTRNQSKNFPIKANRAKVFLPLFFVESSATQSAAPLRKIIKHYKIYIVLYIYRQKMKKTLLSNPCSTSSGIVQKNTMSHPTPESVRQIYRVSVCLWYQHKELMKNLFHVVLVSFVYPQNSFCCSFFFSDG